MSSEFSRKAVINFLQLSFLEFDVNVWKIISSIQRFFNVTKYIEIIVETSLLKMPAGLQIWLK